MSLRERTLRRRYPDLDLGARPAAAAGVDLALDAGGSHREPRFALQPDREDAYPRDRRPLRLPETGELPGRRLRLAQRARRVATELGDPRQQQSGLGQ